MQDEKEYQSPTVIQESVSELFQDFTDWEASLSIEDLLQGPINVEYQPFSRDPLSPTPIDPFNLTTEGTDYPIGATHYMELAYSERVQQLGITLPDYYDEAIRSEIQMSHAFQLTKNSASMVAINRQFIDNPASVTRQMAERVYLERIGQGSSSNRLRLLDEFDGVESIEDMKLTAPLDERKVMQGLDEYYKRIRAIAESDDITLNFIPFDQQPIRQVDVHKTAHQGTIVTKRTIATACINGKLVDLKQKDSYVCFALDVDLGNAIPVIRRNKGVDFNLQHEAVSAYWAVRPTVEK